MYAEETQGILIIADPHYLPEQSRPEQSLFVYGYTITISNRGEHPVQLLSRHWRITDGTGSVREVTGEGVVGQQPLLQPGEGFQYSSFSPIATPTGNMRGFYMFKRMDTGETVRAKIPLFFLRDSEVTVH